MTSLSFRSIAKRFAPISVLRMHKQLKWAIIRKQYGELSVTEAFQRTYNRKLWGNIEGEEFFSGGGSLETFVTVYNNWLSKFIIDKKINTVIDLGCGDFRVGRQICSAVPVSYVGIDIVPDLITYNQTRFGDENIGFICTNIIEDEIPGGDLCLIRQVLQHLSNTQISRVLANCAHFPYLVVTEDVYNGPGMRPNLDIKHGPDNRLFRNSGVFLDRPPFNMQVLDVLEIPCPETSSIIRTCLIEGEGNRARRE